jgi:uncharacterized protein
MKWQGREQSSNVDDRRGGGGKKLALGGGLVGIIFAIIVTFVTKDPTMLIQAVQEQATAPSTEMSVEQKQQSDEMAEFVGVVLKDTEDVWAKIFREKFGKEYVPPTLVIFNETVESGCGNASAATGPFYCPADQKVYIDLSFFNEMRERFKAPGDFACAYVIAHEVGHHVQNLLGASDYVHKMRSQVDEVEYNKLSVKLELQADFYAGVWANQANEMKNIIESGDVEEALNAANAIGDDRLQRESQGRVVPDAFTHGTSEQRMRWFKKGFSSGDIEEGDTFNSPVL